MAGRCAVVSLAPADYHLLIAGEGDHFELSTEPPVSYARPSIDVLFESAAEAREDAVIAVVLTGTNSDGARGVVRVKEHGGTVIVQDPATAVGKIMPRAAIEATRVDRVLPLHEIAGHLCDLVHPTEAMP